jgi:hypothetical protein
MIERNNCAKVDVVMHTANMYRNVVATIVFVADNRRFHAPAKAH